MKNKVSKFFGSCRGFVLGVAATVLVMGVVVPAMADSEVKDLRVAVGGIKIYVDGDLQHPTNANGDTVEPFIYDGTTYLPVRALTNMLTDKAVTWDQDSYSIYIGKVPSKGNVGIEELKGIDGKVIKALTGKDAQFKILEKEYSPNNRTFGSSDTYVLSSEYKELHGMFVPYGYGLGNTKTCGIRIYSVDSRGNETLLKEYEGAAGDDPVEVSVNLAGVNYLRISTYNGGDRTVNAGFVSTIFPAFYDVYLTPAF